MNFGNKTVKLASGSTCYFNGKINLPFSSKMQNLSLVGLCEADPTL